MKIIEPNIELWKQTDEVNHIARCARICYRKESGNDKNLIESLIKRNHISMFRHYTCYFIVSYEHASKWINDYFNVIYSGDKIVGIDIDFIRGTYYIVTNGNWNLNHQDLLININNFAVTAEEFANANEIAWNMMRYTFKVTTQISTSRELNRVSPNNIAEQSTRYVYEDGIICRPHWITNNDVINYHEGRINELNKCTIDYFRSSAHSFKYYKELVGAGMHRQDARGVLPLDTATVCVYTYSWREWEEIIKKRIYNTTGKSHPNATIICKLIEQELNLLGYGVKL